MIVDDIVCCLTPTIALVIWLFLYSPIVITSYWLQSTAASGKSHKRPNGDPLLSGDPYVS